MLTLIYCIFHVTVVISDMTSVPHSRLQSQPAGRGVKQQETKTPLWTCTCYSSYHTWIGLTPLVD